MILDQIWFEKYKKLEAYKRAYFINKNPEFNFVNGELVITNHISLVDEAERLKLIRFALRKKRRIRKLQERIENEEHDEFIKEKYLEKLKVLSIMVDTSLVQLDPNLDEYEKGNQINELFEARYPQVTEEYLQTFICEFIDFIKFLTKTNSALEEFTQPEFYDVKYKPTGIDFQPYYDIFQKRLELLSSLEQKKYSGPETKKIIRKFLSKANIKRITIRVEDRMLFSVEPINKRINIPLNIETSRKRIIEIIAHEVCVHVLRSRNGFKNTDINGNSLNVLGISNYQDMDLEEGVATYFEQNIFGETGKFDLFFTYRFYLRVVGIYLGRRLEPKDVYDKLTRLNTALHQALFPDKETTTALSDNIIKRIYADYAKPTKGFVNPKIAIYLIGNRKIWDYIESGGNIIHLFAGKIGIEEIEVLKQKGFNIPEDFLGEKEIDFKRLLKMIESSFIKSK
jgi:hypothetical protein